MCVNSHFLEILTLNLNKFLPKAYQVLVSPLLISVPISVILHMDKGPLLWKVVAPDLLVHFNTIVANVINRAFTDSPVSFH